MQIINSAKVYPVIVIGSGASGGMAAWNLTRQGIDVLLLDAGDQASIDRSSGRTCGRGKRRNGKAVASEPPQFFLDRTEQPYLTPDDRPFELTRVWGHGGKTNVWGRVSLRYSQMDLKAAERDGWEIPWPIRVRRHRAVLRPGRTAHRRVRRDGRFGRASWQQVPAAAAGATLRRTPASERHGQARHTGRGRAARQHDASDARLHGLSLLRQLWRRL